MEALRSSFIRGSPPRWVAATVVGLVLAVFAATLVFVNLRLRGRLRDQIAGRDAQVLHQVALLQGLTGAGGTGLEDADVTLDNDLAVVLQSEHLKEIVAGGMKGVLGARLFNAAGELMTALPPGLREAVPAARDVAALRRLEPVSHFRPAVDRADLFPSGQESASSLPVVMPVLEVWIPLQGAAPSQFIGATELLLDGQSIAAEFAALDRRLLYQATGVFLAGGGLIAAGLLWAFARLQRAHRLLSERTASLLRANAELALAAKTSAVGAVAAHLLHGLKNPLAGLHNLMANRPREAALESDTEWLEAAASTRRMQNLVQEVVRVLREEDGVAKYQVTLEELRDLLCADVAPRAREAGIAFAVSGEAVGVLSNREANLVALILKNLLANALEATPRGKTVTLSLGASPGGVVFVVQDEGPGLPENLCAGLFTPVQSTKAGGTGVGLAICKQLANHLGAALELKHTGPGGCCFALTLPLAKEDGAGLG